MGEHKVTTAGNHTVMCGITIHKDFPIPVQVHYEAPVRAFYAPGMSAHALTSSVFHRELRIAKDGHDCGPFILHIPLSMMNVLLTIIIPNSERKVLFSASTVLMEGTPTACANMWPYTPMLACSELFAMPNTFPIDNDVNKVLVGMTWQDWVAGIAIFAVDAIVGILTLGPDPGSLAGEVFSALGIKNFADKGTWLGIGTKAATGALKMWLTGHGSVEIASGNRAWGGKIAIKRDAKTGEYHFEAEGDAWFEKHGYSTSDSNTTTSKETDSNWSDGTVTEKETKRTTNDDGSVTEEVTEKTYDDEGRETSSKTTTTKYDEDGNPTGEPETKDNPLPQDAHKHLPPDGDEYL